MNDHLLKTYRPARVPMANNWIEPPPCQAVHMRISEEYCSGGKAIHFRHANAISYHRNIRGFRAGSGRADSAGLIRNGLEAVRRAGTTMR